MNDSQRDALRELARGPFLSFPDDHWARNRKAQAFRTATVRWLIRCGYARATDQRIRMTAAGLEAARARGFLPALAKVTTGDSSCQGGGAP